MIVNIQDLIAWHEQSALVADDPQEEAWDREAAALIRKQAAALEAAEADAARKQQLLNDAKAVIVLQREARKTVEARVRTREDQLQDCGEQRLKLAEQLEQAEAKLRERDIARQQHEASAQSFTDMLDEILEQRTLPAERRVKELEAKLRELQEQKPATWRWRPLGSDIWIYDPTPAWLDTQTDGIEKGPVYAAPVPAVDLAERILVPRNPSQEWFDAVGNELHVSDSDVKGMFNAFAAFSALAAPRPIPIGRTCGGRLIRMRRRNEFHPVSPMH